MPEVKFSEFQWKLSDHIRAAFPFILVETHEEERVEREISAVVAHLNESPDQDKNPYKYGIWNCVRGLSVKVGDGKTKLLPDSGDITDLLGVLSKEFSFGKPSVENPMVLLLQDLHAHTQSPTVIRAFRNLSRSMKVNQQTMVLVSPRFDLPTDLEKDVQRLDYALPDRQRLTTLFRSMAKDFNGEETYLDSIAEAAAGTTTVAAENIMASALITTHRTLGKVEYGQELVKNVFEGKIATLKRSFLEYVPSRGSFSSVGGLTAVKEWAKERRMGFEPAARKLHLPYPKGALIAGIRGCGKTTVAQAIASEWGFPFFKLDMGKIFGSLVGQTEANTRSMIHMLESLGRAVILLDEIDKFFNQSAVSGTGDSGTSSRMFGTFLAWLSEKTCPVFMIATANRIEVLPPELVRKGRFDEIFFVDLPGKKERVSIFNSLLEHKFKHALRIDSRHLSLINATDGFSGAEIEAVIEASLYKILASNSTLGGVDSDQLLPALLANALNTVPQSKSDMEYVTKLRERTKGSFRRANDEEEVDLLNEATGGRNLNLN